MKIGYAVLFGMMIFVIWPTANYWLKNSRKGTAAEWLNVVMILGIVVLFVLLLMKFI